MKKVLLTSLILLMTINLFSQDRSGTVFYTDIEQTETVYKINLDLFEPERVKYIEVHLVDDDNNQLAKNSAIIMIRDKKYYLSYNDEETEVYPESIDLVLDNQFGDVDYPQVNVKLFDENLMVIDYSQKVFY